MREKRKRESGMDGPAPTELFLRRVHEGSDGSDGSDGRPARAWGVGHVGVAAVRRVVQWVM